MRLNLNCYQENLWKYASLYPSGFYNLGLSFRLSGSLRPELLRDAFAYVVGRIEVLSALLLGDEKTGFYFETDNDARLDYETCSLSLDECLEDMERFTLKPFDLSIQWPVRVKLYSLPDGSFMLAIVFHHIGIDGVSVVDFLALLAKTYNRLVVDGQYPDLEIPSWQAYVNGQIRNDKAQDETVLSYWQEMLAGNTCQTAFPEIVTSSTDYTCRYVEFEIGGRLMSLVNHVARQNGTTAFVVILAAWAFVMGRFSGQESVFVDNPVNTRPAKSRNLIGFFVNSLPYRADLGRFTSVKALLTDLTRQHRCLKRYRDYTLAEIFEIQGKDHGAVHLGKANVGINFVGWSDSLTLPLETVTCHFYRRLDHFTGLDLLLEVEPSKVGFSRIGYRAEFTESYVQSLISALKEALLAFSMDLDLDLAGISLVPKTRRIALGQEYEKQLDRLLPINESINERFERIALSNPDQIALVYGDRLMTYKDLLACRERTACWLRAAYRDHFGRELPVGEPIGIYTTNKFRAIIWILSILRAGGAYVSLDISYPKERISFMTRDYGIHCVLSDEMGAGELMPSSVLTLSLGDEPAVPVAEVCPVVDKSSSAYIISTSGTTGLPKGVPIRHEQVLTLLQSGLFVPDGDQRVLQFASLCFDVSVWEIFGTLLNGSTLVIATEEQRLDVDLLIDLLALRQVSVALIPPVLLARFPRRELPDLVYLWVGGDSTAGSVIDYWKRGRFFYNGYGPTEATVCATACRMEEATPANDIGLPLVGVTCYVLDPNRNIVPDYCWGELYIGGPQVTSGYINRPELNREKFIPNPFATARDRELGRNLVLYRSGDWVSRLPDGHILFHGRMDFQVKIHGFRVELGEIESALNRCPGVARCVVVAKAFAGEKELVAYVLPDKNCREDISVGRLKDNLSASLPYYMIPSRWVFVKGFPLTVNGKIDMKALPEPEGDVDGREESWAPPLSVEECMLERVIEEVCQMRKVDVEADLFDLGVSSIQVMMIISKAANAGLDISVSTFYRERTIRDIVRGNKSRFCFWADPDVVDAGKPILILICGDAYFNPDYQNFVREFGRDYAILVLDSYHVYFSSKDNLSWPDLVDVYIRMIRLSLGDRMPKVIAGFCIGGELALSVSRVYTTCIDKPVLLLLDSFANRGAYGPLAFDYPRALGEIRRKLEQETAGLLKSQVLYAYPGEVRLFLASQFTAARIQGGETPEVQAQAQRQFRENACAWRSLLPQCRVEWVASDHWHILGEETMRAIHGMWEIK